MNKGDGDMTRTEICADFEQQARRRMQRYEADMRAHAVNALVDDLTHKINNMRRLLADTGEAGGNTGPYCTCLYMAELELEIVEEYRMRMRASGESEARS